MHDEENTSSDNPEEVTLSKPSRPGIPVVVVLAILLVAVGVGAWFGGQWLERGGWESKYDELEAMYTALEEDNDALERRYASLELDNQILESRHAALLLENIALDADKELYQTHYAQIAEEVNRKLGHYCDDRKSFVTPTDSDVVATVMAVAGEYSSDASERWSDYYALYNWVVDNIEYSHDTRLPFLPPDPSLGVLAWQGDYWRTPSETLEDGMGDCEDMACLLASMLKSYTQGTITFWVITWNSDNSGHAAVAFPVQGGYLTILDPAGNYQTGYPGYKYVCTAVADWLALWPSEPGIHVSAVFSDTECTTFDSTDEFVDWAAARA